VHGTFDFTLFLSPYLPGGDLGELLFVVFVDGFIIVASIIYARQTWKRIVADIGAPLAPVHAPVIEPLPAQYALVSTLTLSFFV
jgi:hypothetical protein